jgi:hypothetical protein
MSWFSQLVSGGVGELVEKVGDTVDRFHLSGEEKQKFKLELRSLLQQRQAEVEQTVRKNLEARERVLVAELTQGDNYTKRARPTVVYGGLIMIGINYVIAPFLAQLFGAGALEPFQLPMEFWAAWGGVVATWSIGRSLEKANMGNKLSHMITGGIPKQRSTLLDDDVVG